MKLTIVSASCSLGAEQREIHCGIKNFLPESQGPVPQGNPERVLAQEEKGHLLQHHHPRKDH